MERAWWSWSLIRPIWMSRPSTMDSSLLLRSRRGVWLPLAQRLHSLPRLRTRSLWPSRRILPPGLHRLARSQEPQQKQKADGEVAAPATAAPTVSSPKAAALVSAAHPASEGGKRIVASPYAKKLAKELKVDLAALAGSRPMGRIVAKDVEATAAAGTVAAEVKTATPAKVGTVAPGIELGSVVLFTTMQGAVSRNLVESLTVPTFRVGYTIITDALDALYKKHYLPRQQLLHWLNILQSILVAGMERALHIMVASTLQLL
ncbi:hypothetical protein SLA2020_255790 [Shorea laevis]